MPFLCGSSNRSSRRRRDHLLRKGILQCAQRVAAFESSEEYATMAPWAAEAYSWDLVLQYLEDTRVATPASASMYQTAPVLLTSGASFSRPASSSMRWSPTTRLDGIPTPPFYRAYSSEDDAAYSSDDTASVTWSSADSTRSSSSAASYTTAPTSLDSKPVVQQSLLRSLKLQPLTGPRIEPYPGRHPDKPLIVPSDHLLAHNDFVLETEWDGFEDWDVDDERDIKGNPQPHEGQARREILNLLVQRAHRQLLSAREERAASVRRVQQWLDSLAPRYTSHRTTAPERLDALDSEKHNILDNDELFAWPAPPRDLRRTLAYREIGKAFEDCEQWPTSTFTGGQRSSAPYADPEAKFRRYLLDLGVLRTYLCALRAAKARKRAAAQQIGAASVAQQDVTGASTNSRRLLMTKSRRSRPQPRKLPAFLAEMFEDMEREEKRRRRKARKDWMRRNESAERVGRMRRVNADGQC
ncbi:uncharacterized protein SCHCODRAFT_02318075 [Schizophyllum commune H4-8]|nr:uncharacterized protein SCHCODRAFT_02318075 [Schizophyllum commune H4-8]KAI5891375.1 hypothetical protein SCHCODRAFT_02318075 [Schizophyllum commune H4-8]